mgnify:CR=1 FL=1
MSFSLGDPDTVLLDRWQQRRLIAFDVGLAAAVVLLGVASGGPRGAAWGWGVIILGGMFAALQIMSAGLSPGETIDFASAPVLGVMLACESSCALATILLGAVLVVVVRSIRRRSSGAAPVYILDALALTGLYGAGVFAASEAFRRAGGEFPLVALTPSSLVPLALAFGSYVLALAGVSLARAILVGRGRVRAAIAGRANAEFVSFSLLLLPLSVVIALFYHEYAGQPLTFGVIVFGIVAGLRGAYRIWESRQAMQRQLDTLATLNRIGQALTSDLSPDRLLHTLYTQLQTLFEMTAFAIALYDEERGILTFPLVMVRDSPQTWDERPLGNHLFDRVVRERRPILATDRAAARALQVEGPVPASFLAAPLIVQDRVIGVLALEHSDREHAYSEADRDLLSTVAAQAAMAIRNARLYEETRMASDELNRLVGISRAFNASLDLKSVARTVVECVNDAVDVRAAALFAWGPDGEPPRVLAATPGEGQELASGLLLEHPELVNAIALDGQASAGSNLPAGPRLIPLVMHDSSLGALALWERPGASLTLREARLVEGIALQAAAALHNAARYSRADASLQERVIELSTIEVISRRMSATLDVQTIAYDVLAAAMSAIDAARGRCALVVDAEHYVVAAYLDAQGDRLEGGRIGRIDQGVIGRVLSTGQPLVLEDAAASSDHTSRVSGMWSELHVPIMRDDRAIGVLDFEDPRPRAFGEAHVRFVTTLAEHAAIAIENARLFNERQRQIETLVSLRALSLRLLAALDLPAVVEAVVERAQRITHAQHVRLYLCEVAGRELVCAASWPPGGVPEPGQEDLARAEQVVFTREPYYSTGVRTLPSYPDLASISFEAVACIPIQRTRQVMGALEVRFVDPVYYTPNEIQALDVLANQAAVALENIQLIEQIRAGRDQLQAILDSTREAMLLFDSAGRLLRANPAAEAMVGMSLEPFVGRSVAAWLRAVGVQRLEDLTGYTLRDLRGYVRSVSAQPLRMTQRQFDQVRGDKVRCIYETGTPVLDRDHRPVGWLIVWRDITDERELQMLRQEFTSMIVHDLRNPLTSIVSSLTMFEDLLAEETLDVDVFHDVLHVARNSTETMLNLVQTLLDISRLEQHTLALNCGRQSLAEVVDFACTSVLSLAMGADVALNSYIPEDFPDVWLDEEKVHRILINLLDNALRHTPAGGEIRIEAAVLEGERQALIRVVDTGPGIPPEARSRIFEKFVQLEREALRGHKGTGLGLTFCQLAVEAHGGRIWVEDGPEGGAAFCFTLPLAPVES